LFKAIFNPRFSTKGQFYFEQEAAVWSLMLWVFYTSILKAAAKVVSDIFSAVLL